MDASQDPSTPSPAAEALAPDWAMIRSILSGARSVKAARTAYLPKYPAEDDDEYQRRLDSAPWRPEFQDVIRGISSKPFGSEVTLAGEPSNEVKDLAEDIDGRGNNQHVFAKDVFEKGVSYGACGILVDFPPMSPNATKAQEKAVGARPYWVGVCADEIIAIRVERQGAREIVTHLRLRETSTVIDGFKETVVTKIRVLERDSWEVYVEQKNAAGATEWVLDDMGNMTLGEVPFVLFTTAEREGPQYVRPPMLDVANMQIELYQQLSNKEQIYTVAGSPMLSANGMGPPTDGSAIETGPRRVLYAPGAEGITTSWSYVQPDPENMRAISEDTKATIDDIRRLGLQPTLPKTGNVTATASGIDAAKGHSAVETWANGLKDALEQAWVFTMRWLKSAEVVQVNVNTDFSVGQYGDVELGSLQTMRANGDLSQQSLWDEFTRRGVLGPQFDAEEEVERLLEEVPGDDTLDDEINALPPEE